MHHAFHELELAGWQRAAAAYPSAFGHLTTQAIGPLLDAAAVGTGSHLLDIATGPGYVAAAAAARGARVVGVDFAHAMVEHARRAYPSLDIRQGDAEALPFSPSSFDAAVASFGLLHFARPERALREMHRVLRPGGRAAFTVWAAPDRAIGFQIVLDAIATHGSVAAGPPPGPPFFRFSERRECERALRDAGFVSSTVVEVPMVWRLPSPVALYDAMTEGSVRTAAILRAQPSQARAAIREAVAAAAARHARDGMVELPMPCVLASAQRPPM